MRLTKVVVEQLTAEARDQFVWDDRLPGFGVKVTPKGARVYVYQYRPKHARFTRRYTIGKHGAPWTADKARDAAGDLAARVRLGEDPFAADKARREAEAAATSESKRAKDQASQERFELIATQFVERYAKPKNRNWIESQRIFDREVLPKWRDRPIRSITRKDVIELIDEIEDRAPVMARNVFAQLRKLFNWCIERDMIEVSPVMGLKGPPVPRARNRWLNDVEIMLFWRACRRMGDPFGSLFQLLLLTAQRREEVTGMRWSELNLDKSEWIIPAERAKNGMEHIVDLAPASVELIKKRPRSSEFVFTTTGKTPVSGHGHAKVQLDLHVEIERQAALRESKAKDDGEPIPPWRVHDLRRTAATGMAGLGHAPHVIEAVLNHISGTRSGLVGVYQHYKYREERKAALLAWADCVGGIVRGGKKDGQSEENASN